MAEPLMHALFAAQQKGSKKDPAMETVAAAELGNDVVHLMSAKVAAQVRSISEDVLNDRMELLASTCLQMQRALQWFLEVSMTRRLAPDNLVMYLDRSRYDETPMKVRSSGASSASFIASSANPVLPDTRLCIPGPSTVAVWTPALGENTTTESASTKIVQTEVGIGLLLSVRGRYVGVFTAPASGLKIVERTTAKCLTAALTAGSFASVASRQFQHACRAATTDKASENILTEKGIAAAYWNDMSIHNPCDVHTLARIFGKVFNEFVSDDITGMIRHSLSLNVASEMNAFRRALREEINSRRVRVVEGWASSEVRRYRQLALRVFAGHGRNLIAKRMLLSLLPNGDWRQPDIELFVGPSSAVIDVAAAKTVIANGLITALAGSMYEVYPRHRWVGADIAVDRCSLLCLVHGLGPGAYARYMRNYRKSPGTTTFGAESGDGVGDQRVDAGDNTCDGQLEQRPEASSETPGVPAASDSWVAFNSASRRIAAEWWSKDPTLRLVIIRLVMEPARDLMSAFLGMAGHEWDAKQIRGITKAIAEGRVPTREFRISGAASNVLEEACLQRVRLFTKRRRCGLSYQRLAWKFGADLWRSDVE